MLCGWIVSDHVPGTLELTCIAPIVLCGASASWLTAQQRLIDPRPPEP